MSGVPAYSLKPGLQFLIVYMRGHCPDAAYLTHIPDVCSTTTTTSSYGRTTFYLQHAVDRAERAR